LAKLFLDHKTLSFDAEPFRFYCLTKKSVGDDGVEEHSLMGYFSKEKVSALNYNLACILTLPQFQRQGVGTLMISLSYALSVREQKVGSPEKPLSDLGKLSYRAYWSYVSLKLLEDYDGDLTLKELARTKGLCSEDVISTLEHLGLLREWRGQLVVRADRKDIAAKLENYTCEDFTLATSPSVSSHVWHDGSAMQDHIPRQINVMHDRPASKIHVIENFIDAEECHAMEEAAIPLPRQADLKRLEMYRCFRQFQQNSGCSLLGEVGSQLVSWDGAVGVSRRCILWPASHRVGLRALQTGGFLLAAAVGCRSTPEGVKLVAG